MVKTCTKCNKEKSISEYYVRSKTGISNWCKSCEKENTSKNTNRRLSKDRSDFYRRRYRCPDNCVYAFTENNEIVYIGSSDSTPFRLYKHYVGNSKQLPESERIIKELKYRWVVLWYGDKGQDEDRVHQEKMLIQIHQPKFNKIKYKNYNG